MIGELHHRAKDILTIIPSTCRQTQWTTDNVETFAYVFDKRLGATSRGRIRS
ncbi:HWE histidine kinase domain-containing protein [Paracoccus sediminilitoris]|uniref:HWE histidine kinase domain-containing protein n=1 Tax=Paracoccus sediminilitoris TaxID=2202419 RepID=UPI003FA7E4D1